MSPKQCLRIVSLTLLLFRPLHPCSIVILGGSSPTVVEQLSGKVIGIGQFDLMGRLTTKKEVLSLCLMPPYPSGLGLNTAFFKKGEVKFPRGTKHSTGNLKEWKCGNEVADVKTDQAGNFAVLGLPPGKYCLDITGPQTQNDDECSSYSSESGMRVCLPLHESFIINVISSGPKTKLIADISTRYPDCSGGSSLKLTALD